MSKTSFRKKLALVSLGALSTLEAILAACGSGDASATLFTTPSPVFAGYYSSASNDEQLKQIGLLESNFSHQSSLPQSIDEIIRLGEGIVNFWNGGDMSQGFSLGGGYFVTTVHGLIDQPLQRKDANYKIAITPNKVFVVSPTSPLGATVQNITALSDRDIALVYSQSGGGKLTIGFRASNTLKVGEKLYAVGQEHNFKLTVREGTVTKKAATFRDSNTSIIYSGYIVAVTDSLGPQPGKSGSPVFDQYGNLVGVVSLSGNLGGKTTMAISSIDSLALLLAAQKAQLTPYSPAK